MFDENPTRTRETKKQYQKNARRLFERAARESGSDGEILSLGAQALRAVLWFGDQHGMYGDSTRRGYKASLVYAIEVMCRKYPDDAEARQALAILKEAPLPEKREGKRPRTSALKRKHLTPVEFDAVYSFLEDAPHRHAKLAAGLLWFGMDFGLRPQEWATARLQGWSLVVVNAKATNGRANGETRQLHIDWERCVDGYLDDLGDFLRDLRLALEKVTWKTLYAAMRAQLAAATRKAAQHVPSLRGWTVAFYTSRHVAGARAKTTMSPAEVAAFMGHASVRTSRTHYARPGSAKGWWPTAVEPVASEVATVNTRNRGLFEKDAPSAGPPPV